MIYTLQVVKTIKSIVGKLCLTITKGTYWNKRIEWILKPLIKMETREETNNIKYSALIAFLKKVFRQLVLQIISLLIKVELEETIGCNSEKIQLTHYKDTYNEYEQLDLIISTDKDLKEKKSRAIASHAEQESATLADLLLGGQYYLPSCLDNATEGTECMTSFVKLMKIHELPRFVKGHHENHTDLFFVKTGKGSDPMAKSVPKEDWSRIESQMRFILACFRRINTLLKQEVFKRIDQLSVNILLTFTENLAKMADLAAAKPIQIKIAILDKKN
jgi:hypothetical protein